MLLGSEQDAEKPCAEPCEERIAVIERSAFEGVFCFYKVITITSGNDTFERKHLMPTTTGKMSAVSPWILRDFSEVLKRIVSVLSETLS